MYTRTRGQEAMREAFGLLDPGHTGRINPTGLINCLQEYYFILFYIILYYIILYYIL